MRDGYKVRFCYDLWCGDMAFKNSFLVSLGIACANDTYVATHVEFSGGAIYWNVSFARAAHDWEVDTFTLYFMMLYLVTMRWEGKDKWWWVPFKRGLFGVKAFYNIMGYHDGFRFPWKSVWRTKVPLMVAFFVWSAALGKILTRDNLWKRCIIVVDMCCM
jgi:hypothetical protein